MREAFVSGYWQTNLGDDLFLKILSERYPNIFFTIISDEINGEVFNNIRNLNIISKRRSFTTSIIDRISGFTTLILPLSSFNQEIKLACSKKNYIEIGGSIFMMHPKKEKDIALRKRLKIAERVGSYHILGSNFGPYYSENQITDYKRLFGKISGVIFRDKYSLSLFSNLPSVSFAPDIVLTMNNQIGNAPLIKNRYIVFSVVDYNLKINSNDSVKASSYKNLLVNLIEFYLKENIIIVLMSFCEAEGDSLFIEELLNENRWTGEEVVHYKHTNTENSLNILKHANAIVATRFHAMILGWVFQVPTFVISYSRKTTDVIDSLWQDQTFLNIDNIDINSVDTVVHGFCTIPSEKLETLREQAQLQFKYLDFEFASLEANIE